MRVSSIQDDIRALGIEIIWVLEYTVGSVGGTADNCYDFFDTAGATEGWCVGDSQTMPTPYTFDDSPFAIGRGFDMLVHRDTMQIVWESNHGTPAGNENLTASEILAELTTEMNNLP